VISRCGQTTVMVVVRGAAQSQGRSEKGNLHAWSHGQECAGEADTQVVEVFGWQWWYGGVEEDAQCVQGREGKEGKV
jgi:hypothetical protein